MLPSIDHDSCDRHASDSYFALVFSDSPQADVEHAVSEEWLASGVRLSLEFIDPGESSPPPRAVDLAMSRAADTGALDPGASGTATYSATID